MQLFLNIGIGISDQIKLIYKQKHKNNNEYI